MKEGANGNYAGLAKRRFAIQPSHKQAQPGISAGATPMGDVIDLQDYRRKVQQRGKQRKQAGPPKAEGRDSGAGGKPKKKPDSNSGKPDKTPKP